jgi:phosphatidylserine/phosphatidylglycerophosphate/cardiolipin synthase-like enzyme
VSREVLQTASLSRNAAREMLQSIFVAELLTPSSCLWIVSPWLRDIPIIDNTAGSFDILGSELPRAHWRLTQVLRLLVSKRSTIVIGTRPDPGNHQVRDSLLDLVESSRIRYVEQPELHLKGVVGDRFALLGSMNFTYNGIERLTEMLTFHTEAPSVERLRLAFNSEYGGAL